MDLLDITFTWFAYKKNTHKQIKHLKFFLAIPSIIALLTINSNTAFSGVTVTPTAFCTRPNYAETLNTWNCIVQNSDGGLAFIAGVPSSDNGSSINLSVLNQWLTERLGTNSTIIGDMTSSAKASNSVALGSGATANIDNSVALGVNSIASTVIGTSGVTIAGNNYVFAGSTPTGTVSIGDKNKERTITNVAAGRISETSTDAVNGSQLHATNQAVDKLDNVAVKYDTNSDGTKSNSISLLGGDPNKPVAISNVAPGVKDTDAVNLGQLRDVIQGVNSLNDNYIDNEVNNAINISKNYTDQRFNELKSHIDGVKKDAHRAAAIGLAASSLRYDDNPGTLSVAIGSGLWRNQSAFAFGAGYTNENSNVRANVSATTSGGKWGAGVGLSFTIK